ncbi:hypothetical protein PYW08_010074 [Mythimna loreyi]|uniref:Uncharacterized protein n=1 Tax=Mythimna loreyi TaxID=667449 RepID=A0ACC2Q5B0_9NEOP|nr:hypothetical protein PYW08_010074 [Mythimna loreyi]
MTSTSKQIDGETTLDYEQVKKNYFNLLTKNKHLLKDPICTREGIEEKIKLFGTNPREVQDLVLKHVNGKNRLFVKKNSYQTLEILPIDEAFDVLLEAHLISDHGNPATTYEKVSEYYSLPLFVSSWIFESCNVCNPTKKPKPDNAQVVVKSSNKSGRGVWRLNIIQDSTLPSNCRRVCYLLILKEDTTNFVILRPLYDSSDEFALDLAKLFAEFGYPEKVYVPNMIEFYKKIFSLVYIINPEIKISVNEIKDNRVFQTDLLEVLTEIHKWMRMTADTYWEQSCLLVQYKLNTTEKKFTRLFSKEEFIGVPFHQFFNYRFRTKMNWIQSPFIKSIPHIQCQSD